MKLPQMICYAKCFDCNNCLLLIMLDYVIKVNKTFYHQKLLEEPKYTIKENKMENFINDDLELIHLIMNLIMNVMNMIIGFESDEYQDCILIVSIV